MKEITTSQVATLIRTGLFNKKSLAAELGISRPTLDTRISGESSWKKLEIKWVDYLYEEKVIK